MSNDLTPEEIAKVKAAATEYPDDNMTFWNTDVARLVAEVERRRAAAIAHRPFPIMDGPTVPWSVMAPHEAQAMKNHGQTLTQLAARGGLGCSEALAIVEGRKYSSFRSYKEPTEEEDRQRWYKFAERWIYLG